MFGFLFITRREYRQFKSLLEGIMTTLNDIVTKVTELDTVEDSVLALLTDVQQKLADAIASNDPAALEQLAASLDAQKSKLASAVTQNTTAEGGRA